MYFQIFYFTSLLGRDSSQKRLVAQQDFYIPHEQLNKNPRNA
nr:MAG TPA: hypothetical protein [Caudoviricetes sp.]